MPNMIRKKPFDSEAHKQMLREALPSMRKRAMITQALISELNAVDPYTQMTKMRLMVVRLVEMATLTQPDLGAIKEIYDRVEGKVRQQTEVTHDGEVSVRSASVHILDDILEDIKGRTAALKPAKDTLPN